LGCEKFTPAMLLNEKDFLPENLIVLQEYKVLSWDAAKAAFFYVFRIFTAENGSVILKRLPFPYLQ